MVGWAVGGASQDCGAPQGARTACPSTSEEGSAPRAPASGSPRPRGSGGADLEGGDWLVQHATSSKVPMRVPRIPRQTRVPRRRSKEPPSRRGSRGSPSSRTSQGRGEQRRAPRDGVTSPGSRWQAGDEAGRGKAAGPCASVAIATPSGLQGDRTVLGLPAPRTHAPHAPHPRAPHLHTSHPRAPHPTPPHPRAAPLHQAPVADVAARVAGAAPSPMADSPPARRGRSLLPHEVVPPPGSFQTELRRLRTLSRCFRTNSDRYLGFFSP